MADKLVAGSTGPEQGCSLINTHNHGDGGVGSQIPTAGIVDSAVTTAKLADATHKVITSKDMDGNDVYTQYEYRENPLCDINRLGFTEDEIKAALQ